MTGSAKLEWTVLVAVVLGVAGGAVMLMRPGDTDAGSLVVVGPSEEDGKPVMIFRYEAPRTRPVNIFENKMWIVTASGRSKPVFGKLGLAPTTLQGQFETFSVIPPDDDVWQLELWVYERQQGWRSFPRRLRSWLRNRSPFIWRMTIMRRVGLLTSPPITNAVAGKLE